MGFFRFKVGGGGGGGGKKKKLYKWTVDWSFSGLLFFFNISRINNSKTS